MLVVVWTPERGYNGSRAIRSDSLQVVGNDEVGITNFCDIRATQDLIVSRRNSLSVCDHRCDKSPTIELVKTRVAPGLISSSASGK